MRVEFCWRLPRWRKAPGSAGKWDVEGSEVIHTLGRLGCNESVRGLILTILMFAGATAAAEAAPTSAVEFCRGIKPIFSPRCYEGHGPEQAERGLWGEHWDKRD